MSRLAANRWCCGAQQIRESVKTRFFYFQSVVFKTFFYVVPATSKKGPRHHSTALRFAHSSLQQIRDKTSPITTAVRRTNQVVAPACLDDAVESKQTTGCPDTKAAAIAGETTSYVGGSQQVLD